VPDSGGASNESRSFGGAEIRVKKETLIKNQTAHSISFSRTAAW